MSLIQSLMPALNRVGLRKNPEQSASTEATPGVRPVYKINETPEAFGLTVYLPGVNRQGLTLTAEEDLLVVRGERGWKQPAEWTRLYRESSDQPYELRLNHDHAVDLEKISAELSEGVLRVTLPKAEALKPRKIAIN